MVSREESTQNTVMPVATLVGWTSLLLKDDQIIIVGPVVDDLCCVQARGRQLLDDDLLRDTVAAPVCGNSFDGTEAGAGRKIDDGQASPGLRERTREASNSAGLVK